MPADHGVRLATAAAGIRYAGRTDVLLALFDPAPPRPAFSHIEMSVGAGRVVPRTSEGGQVPRAGREFRQRQRLHRQERSRRLQIHRANRRACDWLQACGCISCFDGCDRRTAKSPGLRRRNGRTGGTRPGGRFLAAASAIMTTDTFPKVATATAKIGKAKVTINGIAKGAGMIAPDMATMLSFISLTRQFPRPRCRRSRRTASPTRSTP